MTSLTASQLIAAFALILEVCSVLLPKLQIPQWLVIGIICIAIFVIPYSH